MKEQVSADSENRTLISRPTFREVFPAAPNKCYLFGKTFTVYKKKFKELRKGTIVVRRKFIIVRLTLFCCIYMLHNKFVKGSFLYLDSRDGLSMRRMEFRSISAQER